MQHSSCAQALVVGAGQTDASLERRDCCCSSSIKSTTRRAASQFWRRGHALGLEQSLATENAAHDAPGGCRAFIVDCPWLLEPLEGGKSGSAIFTFKNPLRLSKVLGPSIFLDDDECWTHLLCVVTWYVPVTQVYPKNPGHKTKSISWPRWATRFFSQNKAQTRGIFTQNKVQTTCKQGEFLKILRGKNKDILKDDVGSQNECSFPQIPIMDLEVQTGKF